LAISNGGSGSGNTAMSEFNGLRQATEIERDRLVGMAPNLSKPERELILYGGFTTHSFGF
jgi:hypothetical protein